VIWVGVIRVGVIWVGVISVGADWHQWGKGKIIQGLESIIIDRPLGRLRCRWDIILKWILKKCSELG
jgi:hypothetical protein